MEGSFPFTFTQTPIRGRHKKKTSIHTHITRREVHRNKIVYHYYYRKKMYCTVMRYIGQCFPLSLFLTGTQLQRYTQNKYNGRNSEHKLIFHPTEAENTTNLFYAYTQKMGRERTRENWLRGREGKRRDVIDISQHFNFPRKYTLYTGDPRYQEREHNKQGQEDGAAGWKAYEGGDGETEYPELLYRRLSGIKASLNLKINVNHTTRQC